MSAKGDYENAVANNEFDDEYDDGTVQGWSKDGGSSAEGFYTKNKRFVIGAILLSIVVMVLIFSSLLVAFYKEAQVPPDPRTLPPTTPLPPGAIREVFESGPYTIEAPVVSNSSMWMKVIENIKRPKGNIAIHEIHFSTRDTSGNLIPQSILYNHHAFIAEGKNKIQVLAGFGAEGVESFLSVPSPYARLVSAESQWQLNIHYVSVWQYASGAPISIVVNYTVFYTKLDFNNGTLNEDEVMKWKDVEYDLFGIALKNKAEFDVPGNGGPNSSYCDSATFSWRSNATLVYAQGHIHIGGINITFYDKTLDTTMLEALPAYDDCGFITRIGGAHLHYPLVARHEYTITACYDNSRYYKGVMGLFQCYYSPDVYGFLPSHSSQSLRSRDTQEEQEYFL